jgi:hypothetical protein
LATQIDPNNVVRRGNQKGGPTRQDTYRVTVSVDGKSWDVWDKMSGGEVDSAEYKYKPGGMAPTVSLGGTKTTGNITVSRLYRLVRDHDHLQTLFNNVGRGGVVVKKQPLDIDGHAYGKPIVYTGILKTVTPPAVDSESTDPGMLEIVITTDDEPTVN